MPSLEFCATIEQKRQDLPPFVVVSAEDLASWDLSGTVTVDMEIDGHAAGRRSLKRWDEARWFVDLTKAFCEASELAPGSRVRVVVAKASESLPVELSRVIAHHAEARAVWGRLSDARRRAIREHVLAAKRPETRTRRAEKLLGCGS